MLGDCSEFKQVQDSFRVFMALVHLCGLQQNTSFVLFSISAKQHCLYLKLSLCGLSCSLVTVMVIPVCVWSGTGVLVRDYNTEASRGALKLCWRVVLDLGVGFDFPISMSVLTFSEHTSCATAQFCFDCHKTHVFCHGGKD